MGNWDLLIFGWKMGFHALGLISNKTIENGNGLRFEQDSH
jgi:hypothetical protein